MEPDIRHADAESLPAQRCEDPFPHPVHDVPAVGSRTGFRCVGAMTEAEYERALFEAFGGVMDSRGPN